MFKRAAANSVSNVMHPLFGFTTRPGVPLRKVLSKNRLRNIQGRFHDVDPSPSWLDLCANRFGFFSPYTYPQERDSGHGRHVGVFGGSVASWLCILMGRDLERKCRIATGQSVKVLNFSSGGFKQPQQLNVLNFMHLLGQELDVVVEIGGFNEVALSWDNYLRGVHPWMSSAAYLHEFSGYRDDMISPTIDTGTPGQQLIRDLVQGWETSLRIMCECCRARGQTYVYLLQPNQYFTRKRFSSEERRIAFSNTSPYKDPVIRVYPLLMELGMQLPEEGFVFIDGTRIFDDIDELVYSDNCCHYNVLGNQVLGELVINTLREYVWNGS